MAHSKLYVKLMNSPEWRALRTYQLSREPECQECTRKGLHVAAQCVHHVVPVESGRTEAECRLLAFNPDNLRSLCFVCHAEIHKAERSHSRQAHLDRERERLQRWAERRGGHHFSCNPSRLPNPLAVNYIDTLYSNNTIYTTTHNTLSKVDNHTDEGDLPLPQK